MKRALILLAALPLLLVSSPLYATQAPSGSPRVQGTPAGTGDLLQVNCISGCEGGATGTTTKSTAADPTYIEGDTTNPFSVDLTGYGRVLAKQGGTWNLTNISGVISLPTGAATAANQTTANTSLSTINTTLGSPFQAAGALGAGSAIIGKVGIDQTTPGTTNAVVAGGSVADAVTASGNPVPMGAIYESTLPTYTTGLRTTPHTDSKGQFRVVLGLPDSATAMAISTTNGDVLGEGSSNTALVVNAWGRLHNGSTGSRMYQWATGLNSAGTGIPVVAQAGECDDTSQTALSENQVGNARVSCTNHALVVRPYETGANSWAYAAASGGISNTTTAVTFKASAGTGLKNCLTGVQLSAPTLGAATEVAVRDGASGTVLWRGYMSTAGGNQAVGFTSPICGTAATLMEVVTLTATVTGAVYFNAQGYAAP